MEFWTTFLFAFQLAEKSKQVESSSQQALDAKNEVHVLKRKHASSLRELTRELQIAHSASNKAASKGMANLSNLENNNHQNQILNVDCQGM